MIIGSLIAIAFFIYRIITDDRDFLTIILNIVLSLVIFTSCSLATGAVGSVLPEEEYLYQETSMPIVSLEDNMKQQGKFFLGSGTTNGQLYYYFVLKTEHGFKVENISAKDAYIRYDSQPRIVIKKVTGFKNWYHYIWAIPLKTSQNIIYVPEGTIIGNYNIDLQ